MSNYDEVSLQHESQPVNSNASPMRQQPAPSRPRPGRKSVGIRPSTTPTGANYITSNPNTPAVNAGALSLSGGRASGYTGAAPPVKAPVTEPWTEVDRGGKPFFGATGGERKFVIARTAWREDFGMNVADDGTILGLLRGGVAERSGLCQGYKIVQVGGKPVASKQAIIESMNSPDANLNIEFVIVWVPSKCYRCINPVATTKNLRTDVVVKGWEGGHIFQSGDVFEAMESGYNSGVPRLRSAHGWVSLCSSHGTMLIEPLSDEDGIARLSFTSQLLIASGTTMAATGSALSKLGDVTKMTAKAVGSGAMQLDNSMGLSSGIKARANQGRQNLPASVQNFGSSAAGAYGASSQLNDKYNVTGNVASGAKAGIAMSSKYMSLGAGSALKSLHSQMVKGPSAPSVRQPVQLEHEDDEFVKIYF